MVIKILKAEGIDAEIAERLGVSEKVVAFVKMPGIRLDTHGRSAPVHVW